MGRYLCLYRGDGAFGLVHFHPDYDRSVIHPLTKPSYGHLPPVSWRKFVRILHFRCHLISFTKYVSVCLTNEVRPILKMGGQGDKADELSDDDLYLANYQRRAPHTAINILRMTQVNAAAGVSARLSQFIYYDSLVWLLILFFWLIIF